MKRWILVAVAALAAWRADSATVADMYTNKTSATPSHLSLIVSNDWKSITFTLSSAQLFENIVTGFQASDAVSGWGSDADLIYNDGGEFGAVVRSTWPGANLFQWTVFADTSLLPAMSNGVWISGYWFGNEVSNDVRLKFWNFDRSKTQFDFDIWTSPGQVPIPNAAIYLLTGIAALGMFRGRHRSV